MTRRNILATDLDGTFIPLPDKPQNQQALKIVCEQLNDYNVLLAFVTGRHLESVKQAIKDHELPEPDWIISDVGTTICGRDGSNHAGTTFRRIDAYHDYLATIIGPLSIAELRDRLSDLPTLRLQESKKQGRFKLSYYVEKSQLHSTTKLIGKRIDQYQAPYTIIHSIDPFTGGGLIDLLPRDVSKAHALQWWCGHENLPAESIVYAGDSGNDLAALVAGYRSIVVGNADRDLARQVADAHRIAGWTGRLYLASEPGTSGVLAGCRRFGLFPNWTAPLCRKLAL